MGNPSRYLSAVITELSRLPGIGPKSASRLSFHLLKMKMVDVDALVESVIALKKNIVSCSICGGIADEPICSICSDPRRDQQLLCVVSEQSDVLSIERSGEFGGLYHVLNGLISPLDGVGPEDLHIDSLLHRCEQGAVREVIIAINPTMEGDATGLYLSARIKDYGIRVMRIAHGLPFGSDLEFADSMTIAQSIKNRIEL